MDNIGPITVRIRWGSEAFRKESEPEISEFKMSSIKDAQNLIEAIDIAQAYLDYDIVNENGLTDCETEKLTQNEKN